ncbi:MAG: 3-deoxy-7-phosphoheptulonate synthase [Planctomycetes bacterium]|nr:3-deoxy-7-phosphoheptulonate synthase [Planctomycetota bacterium]
MIIVLKPDVPSADVESIKRKVREMGHECLLIEGSERSVLAVLGAPGFDPAALETWRGVARILRVSLPYKLASREVQGDDTVVRVGDVEIGGDRVILIAGPCAVESREMLLGTARRLAAMGVTVLRGGAYKPRTSPYAFQGLGREGLEILAEARAETGLKIVTEVMAPDKVALVAGYADILQIGARNMQNFDLLKECAQVDRPILLKRGLAATIDEWLQSAEYILAAGKNSRVILCERGIRTFETSTRNTLDLNALPVLRERTHLPVVVDPSHGTGARAYVPPLARAAVAAGANGLLIEVHPEPSRALSDGPQSLTLDQFETLLRDLRAVAAAVGRPLEVRFAPARLAARPAGSPEVAFQGEPGAFSDQAARRWFGAGVVTRPCRSFRDVFESVERGTARFGVVPIENTWTGSIHECIDLLWEREVHIVGEVWLRIVQSLIAPRGVRLEDIRCVYVHPQAAAQCDRFLEGHPEWAVRQVYDTAGGVRILRDEGRRDAAAIAGSEVAASLGMDVVRPGIESDPRNGTRFAVLSREASTPEGADKATMIYHPKKEQGGFLRPLEILGRRGIDVVRLEARPVREFPGECRFHAEVAGVLDATTLQDLKGAVSEMKLVGTYAASAGEVR